MKTLSSSSNIDLPVGVNLGEAYGREEDPLTALALVLGLERLDLRHRLLAFGIRFEEVDPERLRAVVRILSAPKIRQMTESGVSPSDKALNLALEGQQRPEEVMELGQENERARRVEFCKLLCMRDHALLPHGWSFRYLWDRGDRFVESFASNEERACLSYLAAFATRKARFTSVCALVFGGFLALMLAEIQILTQGL